VLHLRKGLVGISNVWTTLEGLDWTALLSAAALCFQDERWSATSTGQTLGTRRQPDSQPSDRSAFGSVDTVPALESADNTNGTGLRSGATKVDGSWDPGPYCRVAPLAGPPAMGS
jgi:hypothetical protein